MALRVFGNERDPYNSPSGTFRCTSVQLSQQTWCGTVDNRRLLTGKQQSAKSSVAGCGLNHHPSTAGSTGICQSLVSVGGERDGYRRGKQPCRCTRRGSVLPSILRLTSSESRIISRVVATSAAEYLHYLASKQSLQSVNMGSSTIKRHYLNPNVERFCLASFP